MIRVTGMRSLHGWVLRRKTSHQARLLAAAAAVLILGGACNSSPPSTRAQDTSPVPWGASGCRPASPSSAFSAEVRGTAAGGTVWAWFMAGYPPLHGVEEKTVWRLDGPSIAGMPVFSLPGPAGAIGRLDWGRQIHGGSSWNG